MTSRRRSDPSTLGARLRRRALTIPSFWLAAALFWTLAPLTGLAVLISDIARRRRLCGLRAWFFLGAYLAINLYGQLLLLGAWIATGFGLAPELRGRWTYWIQRHWAGLLFAIASRLWRLRWTVEGDERVEPAPAIYLVRHASLIDTMVPNRFVTAAHSIPLRCVVKRELLNEPCLDIAGHWIPNHFVDRIPEDSGHELRAIEALAAGLDPGEGLMIYPEGTRFTPGKRARVIASLAASDPPLAAQARALEHTLLPRVGGALALMRGAPEADVVIVGHHGLGGFATLADMLSGALLDRSVHVAFWRYPASALPTDDAARGAWIRERWAELDRWISAREAAEASASARPPATTEPPP
ncbi:1-acyl-sn-glycerol-3-phosphate acyltransferase [Pseudenhygromyxa sp. WMMC2535]|uniref:lysophospholipid acyltransferase family protein n=1 Tax=Pseudenhygromyxa sp. WMMC2535 TaxID=2712867 RepID=UPI0015557CB1|nr:lysophospholipid acyltransferase family protein [Pseudenhygromyxa sp. WMMC2535]NVB40162.1 1-acyl-sn-glycerol-3-phosphate acyltransferase [Pseudenhygromyxa sp. WMMC2535]